MRQASGLRGAKGVDLDMGGSEGVEGIEREQGGGEEEEEEQGPGEAEQQAVDLANYPVNIK